MHDYLRQYGFDSDQCKALVWAYQEARGGGTVGRTDFLLALQTQLDGLDHIEEWVDDDAVIGDAYENLTGLDSDRARTRTLMDKVGSLSDQQIADIGIYCLKFWER
jgi:hypothetical protein